MSQVKAGAAYVELTTRNARFLTGLAAAQRRLTDFGQSARLLGSQIAAAGGAAALPLALSARTFMAFDDQMRAVGAVTQAGESDLAALTAEAKRLGATTSYSASEVAGLMTELGRAGFNPDQIIDMTAAVMNLARATGTDATLSAGIMAATIRQFGLAAADATRVADGLTQAANASFTSVEGLGESLQYAGPVAADANMALEETLAILGTLGNVGIQGSEAGTALRRLLTLSAAEAKRFGDQFGVATADASGNLRPLVEILGDVATATQNLPSAERGKRFAAAFGLLGVTAASSIGKAAGDTRELLASIRAATGVASKSAAAMESGIGGSYRILLSSIEGVAIAIGDAIQAPLKRFADAVSGAFTVAIQWIEANQDAVATYARGALALVAVGAAIFATGAAFAVVGAAIAGISTTLAFVGGMFAAVGSIVAGLLSPIGLVSVAVLGLGGYLLHASGLGAQALDWLAAKFGDLYGEVSFAIEAIADALRAGNISGAVDVLWATLSLQWAKGTAALTDLWVSFRDSIVSVASSISYGIAGALSNGWASVEVAWVETIDFLADSWALFTDTLTRTWNTSIGFIEKAWVRLKGLVSDDVDVQAEITRIDSRTANANQAAASDLSNRIADRAAQRATRRRDIEANRTGRADILDQMAATDTAARRDRSKAQIDAAASNLTAARQAQLRAATLATIERPPADTKPPASTTADEIAQRQTALANQIAAGTNAAKSSGDTAATFNAAAARGLGADTIASQQLTALHRIATATEKTADGIAEGDLYE
jgi:TP901 family phage tail tape measure protein